MTPFLSQITGIIRRGLSRTYLLPLSRLIGQKFLLSRVLVTVHETLLRDLYNILQCVFDPKPLNPKPILLILNQYIYSNPLFAETEPDLTKYISDLEIGLKVPTWPTKS